jgi:hypothetical protein
MLNVALFAVAAGLALKAGPRKGRVSEAGEEIP